MDSKILKDFSPEIQKQYHHLAHKRITPTAFAELVAKGQYAATFRQAVLVCFHTNPDYLTKKENKVARLAYDIGQALYMMKINQLVLTNDRAHQTLKVIAELKGLFKAQEKETKDIQTNLTISLDTNTQNQNQNPDNSDSNIVAEQKQKQKAPKRQPLSSLDN